MAVEVYGYEGGPVVDLKPDTKVVLIPWWRVLWSCASACVREERGVEALLACSKGAHGDAAAEVVDAEVREHEVGEQPVGNAPPVTRPTE